MSLGNSQNEFVGAQRRLVSMRGVAVLVATVFAWQAGVSDAAAQAPSSVLNKQVVTPGAAATVTVTGTPGHYFAIVGSTTGAGFSYAGVQFAVGPDVVILAMGNLDGSGHAVVNVVPPFVGSSLDRYYIQAVTSTVPNFVPLQVAPGNVVVNGDLAGLAASGLVGPAGPAGAQGPAGPAGATGAAGPQGPAGSQGPAGAVGAVGPVGPAGSAGPQGPAGNDGAAGATGPQGPAGADGAAGPAGPQGPAGADGAAGAAGAQGPAGADGAAGPQGPAGNDGAPGAPGPQGPAGNDGAPGALGPQGPAGADGAAGAAGPQGPVGAQGPAGNDGALGPIGPAGPQGPQGIQGPQGPAGANGIDGTGVSGYELAASALGPNTASAKSVTATCPAGKVGTRRRLRGKRADQRWPAFTERAQQHHCLDRDDGRARPRLTELDADGDGHLRDAIAIQSRTALHGTPAGASGRASLFFVVASCVGSADASTHARCLPLGPRG